MTQSEYETLRPGDIIKHDLVLFFDFMIICRKDETSYWIVKQHPGMPSLHTLSSREGWSRKLRIMEN